MPIEVNSEKAICFKCGTAYGRRKGYFPVNYSILYKGIGYLPYCKPCIDSMYNSYLAQCHNAKDAVRQMCRKLDLYWSESVFDVVSRKNTERSMMTQYIAKINTITYAGKCYDNTLSDEGTLWTFGDHDTNSEDAAPASDVPPADVITGNTSDTDITDDIVAYWGYGLSQEVYAELEQRREHWLSSFPSGTQLDAVTEALLRQICFLEIDINHDRAMRRSTDKKVATLKDLLNAMLKQAQKKDDLDATMENTPLGVWIYRYENKRPLPEVDDDLKDTNHILRYVFTWLGHVCKMLGKKNGFSRLYEKEVARLRVERPEFNDEDDEEAVMDVLEADEDAWLSGQGAEQ